MKRPSLAFIKKIGASILLDVVFGPRVCASCLREGDVSKPARFGAFSRCARCSFPKTTRDEAFVLMHIGSACPICRIDHYGACDRFAVEKIRALRQPQG